MADSESTGKDKSNTPKGASMPRPGNVGGHARLKTDNGQTSISGAVVSKISGMAAREIPGVHSMGSGSSRRMGQLRALVPGSNESLSRGVAVEVGEKEAAIDMDVVTWYGQSIVDVTSAVRDNVIDRVESMTGLHVVEVNINVDDVYVEGDDEQESRVQ
ncbi:Asp23/Gls24 family envelope stress response protein [Stackebrandtia soli]|uniref:Asp23/Gls24 family envelope stress response protein n=1 Tax=Stackebrandtia soli TaxID=1892856 RepID=UPI0039EA378A